MDSIFSTSATLIIIFSLFCSQSRAESSGSVLFLDSNTHQFLRTPSRDAKIDSMLLPDLGAAVSVLLGFAPPPMLSAAGASKLNEVLTPNPFDRPRAVFMLEVGGTKGSELGVQLDDAKFSTALKQKIVIDSTKASIQLPDEDEVTMVSLDGSSSSRECTDNDISDFASWLGGSYLADSGKTLNGELVIPLASGARLNLHMSKKADQEFTLSLVLLIRDIRKAKGMHKDFLETMQSPAELLNGKFNGIKVLQEEYGTEGVAQQGVELFMTAISKIYESLQAEYKGQLVGVIFFNGALESDYMLDVMFNSRPSSRWLEEEKESPDLTAIARVVLVRRTLAWVTGIILIIATLIGVYFLMNMPLTRDTLLYSNVKLD